MTQRPKSDSDIPLSKAMTQDDWDRMAAHGIVHGLDAGTVWVQDREGNKTYGRTLLQALDQLPTWTPGGRR